MEGVTSAVSSFTLVATIMDKLVVVFAVLAAASAAPLNFGLGAPLLGKVSYAPAEYTHIRPEMTVQQPEYIQKAVPVPVPVAQPYLTEPVVRNIVHPAPAVTAWTGYAGAPLAWSGLPAATAIVA